MPGFGPAAAATLAVWIVLSAVAIGAGSAAGSGNWVNQLVLAGLLECAASLVAFFVGGFYGGRAGDVRGAALGVSCVAALITLVAMELLMPAEIMLGVPVVAAVAACVGALGALAGRPARTPQG
jgi:hypothetical protein